MILRPSVLRSILILHSELTAPQSIFRTPSHTLPMTSWSRFSSRAFSSRPPHHIYLHSPCISHHSSSPPLRFACPPLFFSPRLRIPTLFTEPLLSTALLAPFTPGPQVFPLPFQRSSFIIKSGLLAVTEFLCPARLPFLILRPF